MFHALSVKDIDESLAQNKVIYSEALSHIEPSYIKMVCEIKFGIFGKEAVDKCKNNIYSFCWDECNKEVSMIMNVLD